MTGLWYLPFLLAGIVGTVLLGGAYAGARTPEQELRGLVRDDAVAGLVASLRVQPRFVRSSRRRTMRNRLVLDLGDVQLDVRCYTLPPLPVQQVTGVYFRPSVGWVIETFDRGQRSRFYGWLLDVRSTPRPA